MKSKLIFLHGGPGYPDYMEQFFSNQFSADIEPVFFTQLQKSTTTLNDLIEQVSEHAGATDDQDIYLVGHSWGGALAVEYLRQTHDERVKGIILIGAYLHVDDVTKEFRKELARLKMVEPTTEDIFLAPEELEEAGDLVAHLDRKFNKPFFKKFWDTYMSDFDALDFVKRLHIPVLNIFGEFDVRIPTRKIRTYGKLGPHVTNLEIVGAAHFPFIREKDRAQVIKATEEFITQTAQANRAKTPAT